MKKSILCLGIIVVIVACTKHDAVPVPTIFGKWNWIKNLGGITGNIEHTPKSTGHQLTYVFNKDLSCTQLSDQDTIQQTTFAIARDTFQLTNTPANILTVNEQFYVIGSQGQDSLVIVKFRAAYSFNGDSLILKEDHYDGYTWWYLRDNSK